MIDINLLPYEKRTSKAAKRLVILFASICLLMLIVAVSYTIHLSHELQQAEQEESQWQARSEVRHTIAQTPKQAKQNPTAADAVSTIKSERIPLNSTLLLLQHQLPAGGSVQQLSFDATGSMSVTCGLDSYSDMQQFIAKLRKNDFSDVSLTQITNGESSANVDGTSTSANTANYQVSLTLVSHVDQGGSITNGQ